MKARPWLYIPVETKVRELHGKALLAAAAAEAGFIAVLGQKTEVVNLALHGPRGVVLVSGSSGNFEKMALRLRSCGHVVVAQDEEGLVTLPEDLYLRYRISRKMLQVTNILFCWGKRQSDMVAAIADDVGCKVIASGNPRFDVFRPMFRELLEKEAEKIRRRLGPFILINTNFGTSNHFKGRKYSLELLKSKGWMSSVEDEQYHNERIKYQETLIGHFNEAILTLSKAYPDIMIVVRPHPSEHQELWRAVASNTSNVFVIHEGNVAPWILASQCVIHNGCTTAVEAFILNIPAVSFRPVKNIRFEAQLPNELSVQANSCDQLIYVVNQVCLQNALSDRQRGNTLLSEYVTGIEGPLASDRIVEQLTYVTIPPARSWWRSNVYVLRIILARGWFRRLKAFLCGYSSQVQEYIWHKYPSHRRGELRCLLKTFATATGRFKDIKISRLGISTHLLKR